VNRLALAGQGAPPARDVAADPGCSSLTIWVRTFSSDVSRFAILRQEALRETVGDPAGRSSRETSGEIGKRRYGRRGRARFDSIAAPAWPCQGTLRRRGAPRALCVARSPITAGPAALWGSGATPPFLGGRSSEQRFGALLEGVRDPAGASAIGRPAWAHSADGAVGPQRARRVAAGTSDQSWHTLTASPFDPGQAGANLAGPTS
jgi:hypothetical protein